MCKKPGRILLQVVTYCIITKYKCCTFLYRKCNNFVQNVTTYYNMWQSLLYIAFKNCTKKGYKMLQNVADFTKYYIMR